MGALLSLAILSTTYAAMPADLMGSWTHTHEDESFGILDYSYLGMDSARVTRCMNIPDLSLTTAVVEYGAGHLTYTAGLYNPSDVGWNQDIRTTMSYSAVSGSTTEVELRVTTTAAILSDWTTPSTTCTLLGVSDTTIFADESEIYEQRLLNQMSAICRASRSQDVLYMSCRSGVGGSGRRRNALWSNCPKTAPVSSRTATSESGCITATIY